MKKLLDNINITGNPNECWEWKLGKDKDGYGYCWINRKISKTHRLSYEYFNPTKTIEGKVVRHKCDNPKCCNPFHLESGTQYENIEDRNRRGRTAKPKGEKNGRAKLNNQQVLDILNNNESVKLTAMKYAVSVATIYQIRQGKKWSHIERTKNEPNK